MRQSLMLLTSLVLFTAGPARAILIDLGDVTRDTATGLDWLDLPLTEGISMFGISLGIGGWQDAGWRHATTAEVCGLFSAHAFAPTPCTLNGGATTPGDVNEALIQLLGVTIEGPVSHEAFGYFEGGFASAGIAGIYYRWDLDQSLTGVIPDTPSARTESFFGNFLVRPIPEPSTGLLMALGLAMLAARRGKRRRNARE